MNKISVKNIFIILTTLCIFPFVSQTSHACSVFCLDGGNKLVVGRNNDWDYGAGMIIVNKRDQIKTAFTYQGESKNNLAGWISKYGSITFVQYGREIAFSGMNEAGLVVNSLQLLSTKYSDSDSRSSLSADQYVQFLLDNYKDIDEIIKSDKIIRIRPSSGIHYFVVDKSCDIITIEFLKGKTVFHYKETLPIKVLTNDPYEYSVNYFMRSGMKSIPDYNVSSVNRFVLVASMVSNYKPANPADTVNYAFDVLDSVRQLSSTKFQIVFDIENRMIYFKSQGFFNVPYHVQKIRYFSFGSFDFSPYSTSKILDLNTEVSGDVTADFKDYSTEINEDLIKNGWNNFGVKNIYLPSLWAISHYPDTFITDRSFLDLIKENDQRDNDSKTAENAGKSWTALIEAAGNGNTEALKSLINSKTDVNTKDINGETALIEAAGNSQAEAVELLINVKADVNIKNSYYGYTALMYAAHYGMTRTIKLLIDAKADLNTSNIEGKTALMIAALENQPEAVKLLIEAGADSKKGTGMVRQL